MQSLPSLQQRLHKIIVPRLIGLLIVFIATLGGAIFFTAKSHLNNVHQTYIESLTTNIDENLDLRLNELMNIANNDLLVNGLIDSEYRTFYLPLFIQSLKITKAPNLSIALFDFSGELMLQKNWQGSVPNSMTNLWQNNVLDQALPYSIANHEGVLLAAPILINGVAEGALVIYFDGLKWLVNPTLSKATQVLLDPTGHVFYSSAPDVVRSNETLSTINLDKYFHVTGRWKEYEVISFERVSSAYQNIFWVIPLLLIIVVSVILAGYASVRMASSLAASTLSRLHKNLEQQVKSPQHNTSIQPESTLELEQIRTAFNSLVSSVNSLSLSNNKFSNVIHSMSELLLVVDNRENVLLTNQAFNQFTRKFELSGQSILKSIPDNAKSSLAPIKMVYSHADQEPMHVRWSTSLMQNDLGEIVGYILVGENITQQVELEQNLVIRNRAMDEATVSIVLADITQPNQPLVYVNNAFEKLTGYGKSEVIGQNCRFLQGEKTAAEDVDAIRQAIIQRRGLELKILNYRKNGNTFYNQLTLSPVQQADGEITHYIGILQDVTVKERTAQYLEDAKHKAEESAQLKSRFLASMSHEIRTPINGIFGMLGLLKSTELNKQQQNYVAMARDSTRNLLHIINDVLDFSKIEAGKLNVEHNRFNLKDSLEKIIEHFRVESQQKQLPIQLRTDLCVDSVKGDAVRLRQVIGNLLSNALKFTEQGEIEVSVKLVKQAELLRCDVDVTDSGIGIEQNKLENIFSFFSQADASTTRKYGGTGLGLTISRELVHLMGGEMKVSSTPGKGSKFSFYIYLTPTSQDALSNEDKQPSSALSPLSLENLPRILLVEDNKINQIVAREHLKPCKVLSVENGEVALQALNQSKVNFDVILMDCQMPVMDGFETTRRIRAGEAGEAYVQCPIIALTANAMKGDKEHCLANGMNDYISKPFEAEELQQKVYLWLQSDCKLSS